MTKLKSDESQNIEYKESWRDDYLKWICGFANAQGGKIFIGVDDDHKVVGVDNSERLMEDIPNKIVTQLGIVCEINLHETDNLKYIEIIVEPNNVPISFRGHYHYRSGSTKQELVGVALQDFILKKMGHSWDEISNSRVGMNDLDRNAIDYFLKKGIKAGRIGEDELNSPTEDVLENLHLLDNDGHLTNAAILLFAKVPQKYFAGVVFQIGRFGRDEGDLLENDFIEGNILQMADKVMDVLRNKYLHFPISFEGMQRIEKMELPDKAMREILYNAIVHKDYAGAAIQMHIYDDCIEIWNPGPLPAGYDQEHLMEKHSSQPRNKNVAFTFFKAGFIDSWGRGYKKIKEGFEEVGLRMPIVENVDGGVKVTIYRNIDKKMTTDVVKDVVKELTERQQDIYTLMRVDVVKGVVNTAASMARRMSVSERTIQRDFEVLQNKNLLRRNGGKKDGYWEVVE